MLHEVLGDIWVVATRTCRTTLDNPKRRKQLIDALHHRSRIDRRASPPKQAMIRIATKSGRPAGRPFRDCRLSKGNSTRPPCASRRRRCWAARDNIKFDGLSRVPRDGRHHRALK